MKFNVEKAFWLTVFLALSFIPWARSGFETEDEANNGQEGVPLNTSLDTNQEVLSPSSASSSEEKPVRNEFPTRFVPNELETPVVEKLVNEGVEAWAKKSINDHRMKNNLGELTDCKHLQRRAAIWAAQADQPKAIYKKLSEVIYYKRSFKCNLSQLSISDAMVNEINEWCGKSGKQILLEKLLEVSNRIDQPAGAILSSAMMSKYITRFGLVFTRPEGVTTEGSWGITFVASEPYNLGREYVNERRRKNGTILLKDDDDEIFGVTDVYNLTDRAIDIARVTDCGSIYSPPDGSIDYEILQGDIKIRGLTPDSALAAFATIHKDALIRTEISLVGGGVDWKEKSKSWKCIWLVQNATVAALNKANGWRIAHKLPIMVTSEKLCDWASELSKLSKTDAEAQINPETHVICYRSDINEQNTAFRSTGFREAVKLEQVKMLHPNAAAIGFGDFRNRSDGKCIVLLLVELKQITPEVTSNEQSLSREASKVLYDFILETNRMREKKLITSPLMMDRALVHAQTVLKGPSAFNDLGIYKPYVIQFEFMENSGKHTWEVLTAAISASPTDVSKELLKAEYHRIGHGFATNGKNCVFAFLVGNSERPDIFNPILEELNNEFVDHSFVSNELINEEAAIQARRFTKLSSEGQTISAQSHTLIFALKTIEDFTLEKLKERMQNEMDKSSEELIPKVESRYWFGWGFANTPTGETMAAILFKELDILPCILKLNAIRSIKLKDPTIIPLSREPSVADLDYVKDFLNGKNLGHPSIQKKSFVSLPIRATDRISAIEAAIYYYMNPESVNCFTPQCFSLIDINIISVVFDSKLLPDGVHWIVAFVIEYFHTEPLIKVNIERLKKNLQPLKFSLLPAPKGSMEITAECISQPSKKEIVQEGVSAEIVWDKVTTLEGNYVYIQISTPFLKNAFRTSVRSLNQSGNTPTVKNIVFGIFSVDERVLDMLNNDRQNQSPPSPLLIMDDKVSELAKPICRDGNLPVKQPTVLESGTPLLTYSTFRCNVTWNPETEKDKTPEIKAFEVLQGHRKYPDFLEPKLIKLGMSSERDGTEFGYTVVILAQREGIPA